MSCWWLNASASELDAARTCRGCGCKDADIDLGLCYTCFCREREVQDQAEKASSVDQLLEDARQKDQRITELEAELAESRKDTERLNWLEAPSNRGLLDLHNCTSGNEGLWTIGIYDGRYPFKTERGSVREAIDAAMKGKP